MRPKTSELARGRWPAILAHMGIAAEFLTGKHGPCPVCGGRDRFRFDDKDGSGSYFCQGCGGAGDGFRLLMNFTGNDFASVAKEVEKLCHLPITDRRAEQSSEQKRDWCRKTWGETAPAAGTPVEMYLRWRLGIADIPRALRHHDSLWHKQSKATHHAMVARITNPDGESIGLHRTYLTADGKKAPLDPGKMSLVWKRREGAAVRLFIADDILGIAEGIETALAAARRFSVPCWAGIDANGVASWLPPPEAKSVLVFGDNDENYTGQAAAYSLANRLRLGGLHVHVYIPPKTGKDWADADCE